MKFGIDRLLLDRAVRKPLAGRRVALLAHPASVTADLTHSIDALATHEDFGLTAAFGPQHGMRGEKQDNMVETDDYRDPVYGIPVFSLYGKVRRPTTATATTRPTTSARFYRSSISRGRRIWREAKRSTRRCARRAMGRWVRAGILGCRSRRSLRSSTLW